LPARAIAPFAQAVIKARMMGNMMAAA